MIEKLCTLQDWREYYRRDRIRRLSHKDGFSRVRGSCRETILAVKRGDWSQSDIFGRCDNCRGLTIRGVCQSCGFAIACCVCLRIRQPDKSWRRMKIVSDRLSHTYCFDCLVVCFPNLKVSRVMRRSRGNN